MIICYSVDVNKLNVGVTHILCYFPPFHNILFNIPLLIHVIQRYTIVGKSGKNSVAETSMKDVRRSDLFCYILMSHVKAVYVKMIWCQTKG